MSHGHKVRFNLPEMGEISVGVGTQETVLLSKIKNEKRTW